MGLVSSGLGSGLLSRLSTAAGEPASAHRSAVLMTGGQQRRVERGRGQARAEEERGGEREREDVEVIRICNPGSVNGGRRDIKTEPPVERAAGWTTPAPTPDGSRTENQEAGAGMQRTAANKSATRGGSRHGGFDSALGNDGAGLLFVEGAAEGARLYADW